MYLIIVVYFISQVAVGHSRANKETTVGIGIRRIENIANILSRGSVLSNY